MRYKRPDVGWDEIYVDDLPIIIVFAKRACSNGMALVGVVVKTHPKFHHSVGYCSDGWDASSFEPITGVNWSVKLEGTTM